MNISGEQLNLSGSRPIRPARWWYWAAAALLAAAAVCFELGVSGLIAVNGQIGHFQRIPLSGGHGQQELTFTQPGGYVIFVERPGGCCSFSVGDPGGGQDAADSGPSFGAWSMNVGLWPADGGPNVPVKLWPGAPEGYEAAGHQGQTALVFTIDHAGRYVIDIRNVRPGSLTDLAVGRGIGHAVLMALLLLLAGFFVLAPAGVTLAVVTAVGRGRARRRVPPWPNGPPGPGYWPPPPGSFPPVPAGSGPLAGWPPGSALPGEQAKPGPIQVEFAGPGRQRRATVLLRLLLAVPHLFCLHFARMATLLVLVAGWFGAVFTGRVPGPVVEFLAGFQQWEVRLYSYLLLLTDRYPPMGWKDADYPVQAISRPGRMNRLSVFFRLLLIGPAWWLWSLIACGLGAIVMFVTWLIVLAAGRMPQFLYGAIAAMLRFWARVKGYLYLLTSTYPSGLFGDEPLLAGQPTAAGEPAAPPGTAPAVTPLAPPLPADQLAGQRAIAAAPAQRSWPLVLSRPAKAVVGLTITTGVAVFIAPFLLFALAVGAPPAGPGPAAPAVAADPGTRVPASPSSSPAAAPTAPAAPRTTGEERRGERRWLRGLGLIQAQYSSVLGSGPTVVTRASLRSDARRLRTCTPELAGLGPASAGLRHVYQLARQGCGAYDRAAACFDAAARAYTESGPGLGKFGRLVDCGDRNTNRGSRLLVNAVGSGFELGP
jgi:hypothetical protein